MYSIEFVSTQMMPYHNMQVMQLLAVDLLVYIWHNLPIVGRAAGPVMQFISIRDSLGVHRAAALSILGLWCPLEYWCFQFIRLWRASRVSLHRTNFQPAHFLR